MILEIAAFGPVLFQLMCLKAVNDIIVVPASSA